MKTKCACLLVAGVLGCAAFPSQSQASGLSVHEWGTFTSVQGSDGKTLTWTPLSSSRLPRFVYDWRSPGEGREKCPWLADEGKGSIPALARLETPVVYFYTDEPKEVDVSVRFPKGLITEWFPQASLVGPSAQHGVPNDESRIEWSHVQLLPGSKEVLPADSSGSHYFTARNTDAAIIHTPSLKGHGDGEFEKFLFYRGVANFASPLQVSMKSESALTLVNDGASPIAHLFVLRVTGAQAQLVTLEQLRPGQEQTVLLGNADNCEAVASVSANLVKAMRHSLEQTGLYPREAEAMINTWGDSWFKETGVRVLYVLSPEWTEHTLPMELNPKPGELVRAMVGRSEVISPAIEKRLVRELAEVQKGSQEAERRLRDEIRVMGRFGPPALERAQSILRQEPAGVASAR